MILDDKSLYSSLRSESHFILNVRCDLGVSEKCKNTMKKSYRTINRDRIKNNGQDICLYCSRHQKYMGTKNPNCKIKSLDHNFFECIDSEEKAYTLGWIASDGTISKNNSITIAIHKKDEEILHKIKNLICPDLVIKNKKNTNLVFFTINSKKISDDICNYLQIVPGNKS